MALEESRVLETYFDQIAPNYQFMNGLLSLNLDKGWRNQLLRACPLTKGNLILDVACGTGDVTSLLKKTEPDITALGLDLSFGMLQIAKQHEPELPFLRGTGVLTPFQAESFHGLTIAFGFRNMPDHSEFLKEAHRILKPGGKLLILELTQPENPLLRSLNSKYLRTVLPLVSWFFGRNREAYKYLADSIESFPPQAMVARMLLEHGFTKSSYQLLSFGIVTLFSASKPAAA
jgi:demethylmenaquinone methyltransferase / 2-methoxy-6-polyprenyl-1,4-benzoquinol methylase